MRAIPQFKLKIMTKKLSELHGGQTFKLATSDNLCVFIKKEFVSKNVLRYHYECVNSGNRIETFNDYSVFAQ